MRLTTLAALTLCTAMCGDLVADDFGDAPASYGTISCWTGQDTPRLGTVLNDDTTNPVSPAWTGDNDDGVVGSPLWNPVSWENQLTVHVGGTFGGWLALWVDADDNGSFEPGEFYVFSTIWVPPNDDYTFTGIRLSKPQGYSRNGPNKVAVRVMIQDNWGLPIMSNPSGFFYFGEIEDWLIDCQPAGFDVTTAAIRDAVEGVPFNKSIVCAGGTPPYTWSLASGTLPAGITLTQSGNDYVLAGTAAAGAGAGSPLYTFTLHVTDSLSATTQRMLTLRVLPPPYSAPFSDTFSTSTGWVLDTTWTRGVATSYSGQGVNYIGENCREPGTDATPGNSDNMILADTLGGPFALGVELYHTWWATSPLIDCSALSSVQLRFKRWISTQMGAMQNGHDRLKLEVSSNGTTWVNVWSAAQSAGIQIAIVDNSWTQMVYDISAVAAGQSNVRVRFGVGPCLEYSTSSSTIPLNLDDFAGWCVDDLQVMAPPPSPLQATAFTLNTPVTFVHPGDMVAYPVGLKNYTHSWQATLGNPGTSGVDVSSIDVGMRYIAPPGTTDVTSLQFHDKHITWYDAGQWSLGAPVTLAAGASGVNISGTFACTGLAPHMTNQVLRCTLYVRGTIQGTGQPFESIAVMDCVIDSDPLGLHVFEAPSGGTQQGEVGYGETATGLRNYGSVATGSASGWVNFLCKTNSSVPFNVSPPTLTGADAGQFELYTPSPWVSQPVQGQSNVWFAVRFKPTGLGAKTAWVEFAHTAVNAATPFVFEVKGTGVGSAPIVGVMEVDPYSGFPVGNGAMAAGERDFGMVDVTTTPPTPREFYITNTGTQALNLGTPVIVAVGASPFSLDLTQFSNSVPAGYHTTIVVSYAPTTIGAHSAWISFTHNDTGTTNPFTFEVAGQGVINAPLIEVRIGGPFGQVVSSGAPASGLTQFGALDVGNVSSPLQFHVRNLGLQDLVLSSTVMAGSHGADFVLTTNGMLGTLTTGQATTFEIAFAPLAKGPKAAQIEIVHNDTLSGTPFTIPVAGAGLDINGVMFTTSPVLPAGKIGDAYQFSLAATGGTAPYSYVQISGSLPTGVTLASDGTLSGTPMGSFGVFTFRVRVIDALLGQEERQFDLPVQPPPGHVEKDSGSAGGCVVEGSGAVGWWWLGIMLAAWRRRRRKQAGK